MSAITADLGLHLEEIQNSKNKMAAAHRRFFVRKIHKLKKMLQPLFSRQSRRPPPTVTTPQDDCSDEALQNAMNEALEARLAADLAASPGVSGDAIRALEDGQLTLVLVNPGSSVPVPTHFFTPAHGRFSWTFLPSADYDICPRGDLHAVSHSQTPEQQTPPASPR